MGGGSSRIMILKINPADVVSIPMDYNRAKGRTWKYQVIDEITAEEVQDKDWAPTVSDYSTPRTSENEFEYNFKKDFEMGLEQGRKYRIIDQKE